MNQLFQLFSKIFVWSILVVTVFGLFGNICLFVVYSRGSLNKLSISLYAKVTSIINTFITFHLLNIFFISYLNYQLKNNSWFLCKLITITGYSFGPISSSIQIFISIDRIFKIIYPNKFTIFTKFKFQISILTSIFVTNVAYYSYSLFLVDYIVLNITYLNSTLPKEFCFKKHDIFEWFDFGYLLFQFLLMILLSVILIAFIRKSRNRLKHAVQIRNQMKDIKFAITSFTLNLLFLFLTVQNPCLNVFMNTNIFKLLDVDLQTFLTQASIIIFDSYYALTFYAQLFSNSLIQAEFFSLLALRQSTQNI